MGLRLLLMFQQVPRRCCPTSWWHGGRGYNLAQLAKARSAKLDPPFKLTPHQRQEALRRRGAGEPMRDIARSYNVSHSTISRLERWEVA
ncbi:MAG: Hin recombinase [Proteobacteria bacterium]|nr:Hin recombinase [Pseudomonadota bacterium]